MWQSDSSGWQTIHLKWEKSEVALYSGSLFSLLTFLEIKLVQLAQMTGMCQFHQGISFGIEKQWITWADLISPKGCSNILFVWFSCREAALFCRNVAFSTERLVCLESGHSGRPQTCLNWPIFMQRNLQLSPSVPRDSSRGTALWTRPWRTKVAAYSEA